MKQGIIFPLHLVDSHPSMPLTTYRGRGSSVHDVQNQADPAAGRLFSLGALDNVRAQQHEEYLQTF